MSNEIYAGEGAIGRGAQIVAGKREQFSAEINRLDINLSGIGTQWKGAAAVAFQQLMEAWREDAKAIISQLSAFEQNLVSNQSVYTAEDQAQQAKMSRMIGRLNG